MATRLLSILLLFFGQISYSQIGDTTKFDPDTKQKMVMICDSLKGDWQLANKLIVSKDKKDTINQVASGKSKSRTKTSRPKTVLNFKSNGDLVITEFPFGKKSTVIEAKWKIEVRPFDEIDLFFIEIYNSDNKKFTKEFNGFVTGIDHEQFQLTEKSWKLADRNWCELNFIREGAIKNLDSAKLAIFYKNSSTLTQAQIKTADSILINVVNYYNSQIDKGQKRNNDSIVFSFGSAEKIAIENYFRQYTVETFNDGSINIDAFCFCENMLPDGLIKWKKTPIKIHDGGSCVFSVVLDLTKRIGQRMQVNGR